MFLSFYNWCPSKNPDIKTPLVVIFSLRLPVVILNNLFIFRH